MEAGLSGPVAHALLDWCRGSPAYRQAQHRRTGERQEQRREALALIRSLAPEVFDYDAPRPLARGVHRQLIDLGVERQSCLGDTLQFWTARPEYHRAVADGL